MYSGVNLLQADLEAKCNVLTAECDKLKADNEAASKSAEAEAKKMAESTALNESIKNKFSDVTTNLQDAQTQLMHQKSLCRRQEEEIKTLKASTVLQFMPCDAASVHAILLQPSVHAIITMVPFSAWMTHE